MNVSYSFHFEKFIHKTCLLRCIGFRIGMLLFNIKAFGETKLNITYSAIFRYIRASPVSFHITWEDKPLECCVWEWLWILLRFFVWRSPCTASAFRCEAFLYEKQSVEVVHEINQMHCELLVVVQGFVELFIFNN